MNLVRQQFTLGPRPTGPASGAGRLSASQGYLPPLVATLFTVVVAMMFTLSGSVLWDLGLNYSGLSGSTTSKLHPATYLTFVTFGMLIVARSNPASFLIGFVTRQPGALTFLIATTLLALYIALDGRRGIATIFDNYLLAIMVAAILFELDARALARLEKLLHLLFAANALLALGEYLADHRVFPHRFEGVAFDWDRRSTGFLGHPLENAHLVGTYLIILLAGGGSRLPKLLRAPAALLQLAAMVPFGGRSALLLALGILAIWAVPRLLHWLRGGRISLPALAALAFLIPLAALVIGGLASGGFFSVVLDRFSDDGGSAQTRVAMFEIFEQLSVREIFIGADNDLIDAMRRSRGLEWGIENPIVRLLLYQGAAFTALMLIGFTLFMLEIGCRLRRGIAMPLIFFLIIANSYESFSNKTILLAQFIVLLSVMFAPAGTSSGDDSQPASNERKRFL